MDSLYVCDIETGLLISRNKIRAMRTVLKSDICECTWSPEEGVKRPCTRLLGPFHIPSRPPQRKSRHSPQLILGINLLLASDLQISLFIAGWTFDKAQTVKWKSTNFFLKGQIANIFGFADVLGGLQDHAKFHDSLGLTGCSI